MKSDMKKMTIRQAQLDLRYWRCSLKKNSYGEFVVTHQGSTYHTDDLQDALDTGKHMARLSDTLGFLDKGRSI